MDRLIDGDTPEWVLAGLIAVAVFVGFLVVRSFGRFFAHRLVRGADPTSLRALPGRLLDRTTIFLPLLVGLFAGSLALDLRSEIEGVIRAVAVLGVLLQAALWGSDLIVFWADRLQARDGEGEARASTATVFAARFIATLVLWALLLLLALDNVGVEITALVAGLGIGGIAVALAAQSLLGDLFASLAIVLDQPFVEGDFIVVGEFAGTVEAVGVKTTRLRSLSGEQLIFPNSDLVQSRIRNYKRMAERRVVFHLGVEYDTSVAAMTRGATIIREAIEAQPLARFDRAHFQTYSDSSLDFEAVYYVLSPEYNAYMDTHQAINLELLERFRAEGIGFAYPTRTLRMINQQLGDEAGLRTDRAGQIRSDEPSD